MGIYLEECGKIKEADRCANEWPLCILYSP